MRRIPMLLTVMMAAMVAFSGAALARGGDVCLSIKGQPKVQKGDSICESDSTSKAVAVDDSAMPLVPRRSGARRHGVSPRPGARGRLVSPALLPSFTEASSG